MNKFASYINLFAILFTILMIGVGIYYLYTGNIESLLSPTYYFLTWILLLNTSIQHRLEYVLKDLKDNDTP